MGQGAEKTLCIERDVHVRLGTKSRLDRSGTHALVKTALTLPFPSTTAGSSVYLSKVTFIVPAILFGRALELKALCCIGWTTALISERVRYTSESPTVLQWLLFWIATAMKLPGGWVTPVRMVAHSNPRCHNLLVDMELRENIGCHSVSRDLVIRI